MSSEHNTDQHQEGQTPPFDVLSKGDSILVSVQIDHCQILMNDPGFLRGFSSQELAYISSQAKGAHSLAARYAVKRGAEILTHIPWYKFEITRTSEGVPQLQGRDKHVCAHLLDHPVLISIAHDEPIAVAYLVMKESQ